MVFFRILGLCNIASIIAKLFDRMVRKLTGRQQAEARDAEQILLEALNAGAQKKNKNTTREDGVARWSFVGKNEDEIETYETGMEVKKLPLKERKKRFENIMREQHFVKTVQIDGKFYDVLANVRKKSGGEYVYSIQLNESRKSRLPPWRVPTVPKKKLATP